MFRIGQKVVCIGTNGTPGIDWDAWCKEWGVIRPERGVIYTIRETRLGKIRQHIRLVEIVNPIVGFRDAPDQEPWFWSDAFRPVVDRKTSIDIFTAMLTPSPVTVDALNMADHARELVQ